MSTHTSVLDTVTPVVDRGAEFAVPRRRRGARAYAELAARLFGGTSPMSAVAFASVSPGEGVTHTVTCVADELSRSSRRVTVLEGALCTPHTFIKQRRDDREPGIPLLTGRTADLQRERSGQELVPLPDRR